MPAQSATQEHKPRTGFGTLQGLEVCVVGLGYIGLPSAAVLASRGCSVHGVEVNPSVVETINSGGTHIVEPDLDMLVQAAVGTGRLKAHAEPAEARVFLICVPTPLAAENKPDITCVTEATEAICPYLRPGSLVILESTSPPGTTERIAEIIAEKTGLTSPEISIAHAPERVLPGKILDEVVNNDRIVGGVDESSTAACAEFYGAFVKGDLLLTDSRTAETAKLTENAYRDVNIAFANELSTVSDELGIDVWELINLANRHPRVNILKPGPGVGGHCIAIDPWFLHDAAPAQSPLIRLAREINDAKPEWTVERIVRRAERFKRPVITVLGLAYKPDIDDLRESPAVKVARSLIARDIGEVRVVEPNIDSHDEFELTKLEQALDGADVVVFLVHHREFTRIQPKLLAEKSIIDVCGVLVNQRRA